MFAFKFSVTKQAVASRCWACNTLSMCMTTIGSHCNLSPTNRGPSRADCNHYKTDWWQSGNDCLLIYECRQIFNILQWISRIILCWWAQLVWDHRLELDWLLTGCQLVIYIYTIYNISARLHGKFQVKLLFWWKNITISMRAWEDSIVPFPLAAYWIGWPRFPGFSIRS